MRNGLQHLQRPPPFHHEPVVVTAMHQTPSTPPTPGTVRTAIETPRREYWLAVSVACSQPGTHHIFFHLAALAHLALVPAERPSYPITLSLNITHTFTNSSDARKTYNCYSSSPNKGQVLQNSTPYAIPHAACTAAEDRRRRILQQTEEKEA